MTDFVYKFNLFDNKVLLMNPVKIKMGGLSCLAVSCLIEFSQKASLYLAKVFVSVYSKVG